MEFNGLQLIANLAFRNKVIGILSNVKIFISFHFVPGCYGRLLSCRDEQASDFVGTLKLAPGKAVMGGPLNQEQKTVITTTQSNKGTNLGLFTTVTQGNKQALKC